MLILYILYSQFVNIVKCMGLLWRSQRGYPEVFRNRLLESARSYRNTSIDERIFAADSRIEQAYQTRGKNHLFSY